MIPTTFPFLFFVKSFKNLGLLGNCEILNCHRLALLLGSTKNCHKRKGIGFDALS